MERFSRTLPWDHPAAQDLDKTVHKRRMQGEIVFFVSFPLDSCYYVALKAIFFLFIDMYWILDHFCVDRYCYRDFCSVDKPRKLFYRCKCCLFFSLPPQSLFIRQDCEGCAIEDHLDRHGC